MSRIFETILYNANFLYRIWNSSYFPITSNAAQLEDRTEAQEDPNDDGHDTLIPDTARRITNIHEWRSKKTDPNKID